MTGTFREHHAAADGFRIRYLEAGTGPVLLHLHGAGGPRWTKAHDLLARRFRVILLEMPGFGAEDNTRAETVRDLAVSVARTAAALGLDRYHLMATSFGARVALWLATDHPDMVGALLLEGPAAIRPDNAVPVTGTPAEIARRLYAHPEKIPPGPEDAPETVARRRALTARLRGAAREPALEDAMTRLAVPVLIVFGTRDAVMPPEIGRVYLDLIPDAHLAFVYDAGHEAAMERPEAFAEIAGDFLTRDEAFLISQQDTALFP